MQRPFRTWRTAPQRFSSTRRPRPASTSAAHVGAAPEERGERPSRDGQRNGGRPERSGSRRDSDERDIDEVALERMAREAAEIVRRSGEPELLRPMNSRERWVVHNTLKDERGVRSESEGEGPRKRVRITPD